jgi:hypothetical protein
MIPTGSQTTYYHLLLSVFEEGGAWVAVVHDPFGPGIASKSVGALSAAQQHATNAAHDYLEQKYCALQWPILSNERIRWANVSK